jgi:hypothetical protein
MRTITTAGKVLAGAAALVLWGGAAVAQEKQKQLSDLTVQKYMEFAWSNMGTQYSDREGNTISIDKSKKDEVVVPLETGRDVIIAAGRGARARVCGLAQEEVLNFQSLVNRENAKNKWSKEQKQYMVVLHTTVIQLNAGTAKLRIDGEGNKLVEASQQPKPPRPCTDAERASLKEEIAAYVAQTPEVAKRASQAPQAPAGGPAPTNAAAAETTVPKTESK